MEKETSNPGAKETTAEAKEIPQASFMGALLLSIAIAVAPWVFPSENRSYDFISAIMTFIGVFSFLMNMLMLKIRKNKSVFVPRKWIYGALFVLLGVALTLFFIPPRLWTQNWQAVANKLSSQTWTDGKAYSAYVDGPLDLSRARSLRLTFDSRQAGTKFLLRLLPEGANADTSVGVRWEAATIPEDGVVTLPLKAADFGLTPADMRKLTQISVHSGDNAWSRPLEQGVGKKAAFQKIEVLTGSRNNPSRPLPEKETGTRPPPSSKPEPPGNRPLGSSPAAPPDEHKPTASPSSQNTAPWRAIANKLSSQTWTDGKAYSVYVDGPLDLSRARSLRLTFDPLQAGTKFLLRLLPEGANADTSVGARWEIATIPEDGVVTLPLKAADFGLTPADMGKLVQISVHSGDNAWSRPLEQEADKRAYFEKIEALVD